MINATCLNEVNLIGRIGKEPDVRIMTSGNKIIKFSLATSKSYKNNKTNTWDETTEWHNIIYFCSESYRPEKYLIKGSLVFLKGEIKYKKWVDKINDRNHYKTEIEIGRNGTLQVLISGNENGRNNVNPKPELVIDDDLKQDKNYYDEPPLIDDDIPF